jgi:hypothetical protein
LRENTQSYRATTIDGFEDNHVAGMLSDKNLKSPPFSSIITLNKASESVEDDDGTQEI